MKWNSIGSELSANRPVMSDELSQKDVAEITAADTAEVRDLFGDFHMEAVQLPHTVAKSGAKSGAKQVSDLINSNREARAGLF